MHSSSSPAPRLDQGLLSRDEASRGPVACAQRCQLRGCADHIRALPRAEQGGSNVSTIRPAACAANSNLRQMFHESRTSRQMVQELNPSSATGPSSVTLLACFADAQKACPDFSSGRGIIQLDTSKSNRDYVHGPKVRFPPSRRWSSRMTRYGASLQVLQFVSVPQSYGLRSFRYFPPKRRTTGFSKETACRVSRFCS